MSHLGKVCLIGAGPGDPELLTRKAHRMLQEADVVVFDRLVSDEIMALCPPRAEQIAVGKSPQHHPVPQDRINAILVEQALMGRRVARLKGGDPFIFGRGSEEAEELMLHGIPVEICPGITAAQGAAASSGVPLTHRGLATGVRYVTGHCQQDRPLDLDWNSLANSATTLVVYMGVANIPQIALRLMTAGLPADTPVMAISNATTPREKQLLSCLSEIAADLTGQSMPGPVLFVIGRVVNLHPTQVQALQKGALEQAAHA